MTKLFCAVLFALLFAGCGPYYAFLEDYPRYRLPDYGRPISQYEAEAVVKDYLWKEPFHPRKAQYRFEKIYLGHQYDWFDWSPKTGYKAYYGYILVVHAKGQNAFGKEYEKSWLLVIRDGQIVFKKWKFSR